MNEVKDVFEEGSVVICGTSQAGTITDIFKRNVWVLLQNGDIWVGSVGQIRFPQDQADLDACPLNVERLETKRVLINRSDD